MQAELKDDPDVNKKYKNRLHRKFDEYKKEQAQKKKSPSQSPVKSDDLSVSPVYNKKKGKQVKIAARRNKATMQAYRKVQKDRKLEKLAGGWVEVED